MRLPLPTPWSGRLDQRTPLLLVVGAAFVASAMAAVTMPTWFWLPLGIVAVGGIGVLAFRHTGAFCVAWLLIVGATLEKALADTIGPGLYQAVIAVVKAAEILLAALCVLRYGPYPDVFNPGLAFLAMFGIGLAQAFTPA